MTIFFLCGLNSSAQSSENITNLNELYKAKPLMGRPFTSSFKIADKKQLLNNHHSFLIIPQNYYTEHFGFMCKKELAIEKVSKIPFRFRIGTLQQCNYLEGKK